MEETKNDVLLTDVQHRPKAVQTTVAVLFVVQALLAMFEGVLAQLLGPSIQLSNLISSGGCGLLAVCWGILAWQANNKATRLATLFMAGVSVVLMGLIFFNGLPQIVYVIVYIIYYLVIIYSLSLIMTNNQLSEGNVKWLNTLVATICFSLSTTVVGVFLNDFITMQFKVDGFLEHYYYYGGFLKYWVWLITLLQVIGLWKLARSEVFGGKFDKTSEANLSPFNKWMAAAFVIPSIVTLAIYLLYANSNLFI